MTNLELERLMELHRHEHFATWTDEEHEEYEYLKSKIEESLETANDVRSGKIFDDNGIKNKYAFCILAKGHDIWLADSYQNLLNFRDMESQIIKNKEKETKYDDLMNANSEVVQNNISLTQLQQENKRLIDTIDKMCKEEDENKRLRELVEEWLESQDMPDYGDYSYHNIKSLLDKAKGENHGNL